jgi:hypothetical protein
MKKYIYLIVILNFFAIQFSYAWDNSISFGYGKSHDPNHSTFDNSGFLLSADMLGLKRTKHTFWSINGSLGRWHTTTPINKKLISAALSLKLRAYLFDIESQYPFYLLGSAGPAWISNKRFGLNTQAGNLTIQTNLGLGTEFNNFDINLRLEHFSNANLSRPNEGFNILYLVSIGYLF